MRQIPFTSLLLTGLVPKGKFEENGVGVSLVPSEQDTEETILLFAADKSDHFHNVYLKKFQKDKSTPSCCDLVCFAHKKSNNGKRKHEITICLIELKSGNHDQTGKALDQVFKTYEGIREGIPKSEIDGVVKIIWEALIIVESALPKHVVEELDGLKVRYVSQATKNINLTKFMETGVIETVTSSQRTRKGTAAEATKNGRRT